MLTKEQRDRKEFSHTIHALLKLKRSGKHIAEKYPSGGIKYTKLYLDLLATAERLEPNGNPIGFYLKD